MMLGATQRTELLQSFHSWLITEEYSCNTIMMYTGSVQRFLNWLADRELNRENLLEWKVWYSSQYSLRSANAAIAAINRFLCFQEMPQLQMKSFKVQEVSFVQEERTLAQSDYNQLVTAAWKQDRRMAVLLQTIATTGVRVSELPFITVHAVQKGYANVYNKGRQRTILFSDDLRGLLLQEIKRRQLVSGPVFQTRTGKPLDRSNIWRKMKQLGLHAQIMTSKIYPHNLRHLFAKAYYAIEKDLARLADLLGHSSVDTTRIYTRESTSDHVRLLNQLPFIIAPQKKLNMQTVLK